MGDRRKILFYTHALAAGGAERVLALIASGFVQTGADVLFATDYEAEENAGFLDARARRIVLGANHAQSALALTRLLRREKPDISVSALGGQNLKHSVAALLAGRAGRAILCCHGFAIAEPKPLAQLSYVAASLISRTTARTVCVSDALRRDMITRWHADPRRTRRIYNPAFEEPPRKAVASAADILRRQPRLVLACGRLIETKRFPDLVAAFAAVTPSGAELAILGEGPERAAIEAAIVRHGLTGRVHLPGYVKDLQPWYERAACLAMSSASESFGLVLIEALAFGLPVVATDCGGPPEILDFGRHGRVVPIGDRDALTDAISAALADPGDPAPRIARAAEFSLAIAVDHYRALFDEIAPRRVSQKGR
jgi:glycosyltransferase involved in cell wall biosynthesis